METTRLARVCRGLVEAGWLAIAVAVPLYFNPLANAIFEPRKAGLLRAVVLAMALAGLIAWLEAEDASILRRLKGIPSRVLEALRARPLLVPFLLYALILLVSSLAAVDRGVAFWGSYERSQGLLTVGACVLLALLVATYLKTSAQLHRLLAALALGSLPVAVYGVIQILGADPMPWITDSPSRVLSTLGRSNYFGAYLVVTIPTTIAALTLASSKAMRGLYAAALSLQVVCLLGTAARAAWLAAPLGVLALAVLLFARRGRRRALAASLALAGLVLVALVALNVPDSPLRSLATGPVLGRLATMSQTGSGSLAARLAIWRTTLDMIADRPIAGHGPDAFGLVYTRFFPAELVYYQGRGVHVNQAHNLFLDQAATLGVLGALSYMVLFGATWMAGLRAIWMTDDRGRQMLLGSLLASLLALLFHNQFSLDGNATAFLSWLLLGAVAAASGKPEAADSAAPALPRARRGRRGSRRGVAPGWRRGNAIGYALLATGLLWVVAQTSVMPALADMSLGQATREAYRADGDYGIAAAKRAQSLSPWQSEYRLFLASAYVAKAMETDDKPSSLRLAEEELKEAVRASPQNALRWAQLGQLYRYWGSLDADKLTDAEVAYRRAVELYPDNALLHRAWAVVALSKGNYELARERLLHADSLDETDSLTYALLGEACVGLGRYQEALNAYGEATALDPQAPGYHAAMGFLFFKLGGLDAAIEKYGDSLATEPGDARVHANLALVYETKGLLGQAVVEMERAVQLAPSEPTFRRQLESWRRQTR